MEHLYNLSDTLLGRISKKDLIIFFMPFLIFMIYLFVFNPGILRYDTFNQLHQIVKGQFNNWHPFFHTFIEMLCLKIYPDPLSIGFIQIFTFSYIWTVICNYFRNDHKLMENKGILKNDFLLQVLFTLIISLIPLNGIFAITYLKDTLFSYFMVFSCFLIKVLLDKKGNVGMGFIIVFCLSMSFVAQLRVNGIYVILITLLVLAVYLFRHFKDKKLHIYIPALTIIFILMISSLNVIYDVHDNEKDALFTKTIHMLSDYDLNLTMDKDDEKLIHEVISKKDIEKNYRISGSDKIYRASNESAYDAAKSTYINLAIKYSMENPLHFFKYIFESSPMVWKIVKENDWVGAAYSTNTDVSRENFYRHGENVPVGGYDNVSARTTHNSGFKFLNKTVVEALKNPVTNTLFNSPALYMYMSFILIGAIYLLTKSKDILLLYLPNIINILIIFASTPIQDVRYLYSNMLLFYLLVIILIGLYSRLKSPVNLKELLK